MLAQQFSRVKGQLRFDKVYIETYRSGVFANGPRSGTKHFFIEHGIEVAGGIAYSAPGMVGTADSSLLDYENRMIATSAAMPPSSRRGTSVVILDDFFFFNSKSDADIAARKPQLTRYRLNGCVRSRTSWSRRRAR